MVIGDTVTIDGTKASKPYVSISDQPIRKAVAVQKQDADTGKKKPYNDQYSFDRTTVTIYSDKACTKAVTKVTTDENGYGESEKLYYGTYYAKETKAPSGYQVYDHTFTIEIGETMSVDGSSGKTLVLKDAAIQKPIEVQKADKDTGLTEPYNSNYSFDQMEVTIYKDADLSQAVQVLTTNAKGYAKSKELYYGTYYVRETKAPKGYQLYDHTFTVVIGNTITVDGKKAGSSDLASLTITDESGEL